MWNIKKIVKKGDYLYAVVKEHPKANKLGYVFAHRVIMENHLGRLLKDNEVVHHIDHNKHNNDISNLRLMDYREHVRLHSSERGMEMCVFKCPVCSKEFEMPWNKSKLVRQKSTGQCCSRKCGCYLGRLRQLGKVTHELEIAISENIVRRYKKYPNDNSEETKTMGSVETIRNQAEMPKK